MVEDRVTDGRRIAELLASELDGRGGDLAEVAVVDADRDVEPTANGARAYDVTRRDDRMARVFVHPDRVRVEVTATPEAVADAAREVGLRTRLKSVDPPRTLIFVESGAAVKRASDVLAVTGR